MSAIADLSDLVNRITGGNSGTPETLWFTKDNRVAGAAAVATVAGQWTSLWEYEGFPGGAGARPGSTPRVCDNTTQGALGQADAGGGRQKWLLSVMAQASGQGGQLVLFDRLADISGFDATNTGGYTFSSPLTPSRYTGAISQDDRSTSSCANQIWIEIYDQVGASASQITVNYTQDSATRIPSMGSFFGGTGLREAGRLIPLTTQSLYPGCTSVEVVDITVTTGTAGDYGVTILRPLVSIPIAYNGTGTMMDLITRSPQLVEIMPGACLMWAFHANLTTSPNIVGHIQTIEA